MRDDPCITIVGPGAIGGLLACRLQSTHAIVTLVDHNVERAARLSADGIRIAGPEGDTVYRVPVVVATTGLPPPRWLLLCVKRFQTPAALERVRPLLGPTTCIVSFQNGMGYEDTLVAATDEERVLCAVTTMGATLLQDGHVRPAGAGITTIASWRAAGHPQAKALVAILTQAHLDAHTHANAQSMLWSKLIVNAAINPVTALANVPNGALLEQPELRATAYAATREGEAVAAAMGIALDYENAADQVDRVCAATAENRSSMLQDVVRHRPTEIDYINGVIVRSGQQTGLPTPVNRRLINEILSR